MFAPTSTKTSPSLRTSVRRESRIGCSSAHWFGKRGSRGSVSSLISSASCSRAPPWGSADLDEQARGNMGGRVRASRDHGLDRLEVRLHVWGKGRSERGGFPLGGWAFGWSRVHGSLSLLVGDGLGAN